MKPFVIKGSKPPILSLSKNGQGVEGEVKPGKSLSHLVGQ